MLTVFHILLVLHVPRNMLQEDLLHDFPRHPSEADWSALPCMILLDFFVYGCDISLSPVVADCPQSPWPYKDDRERSLQPCKDIGQSLCTLRYNPSGPMKLHGLSFLKWFLTRISSIISNSSSWTLPLEQRPGRPLLMKGKWWKELCAVCRQEKIKLYQSVYL